MSRGKPTSSHLCIVLGRLSVQPFIGPTVPLISDTRQQMKTVSFLLTIPSSCIRSGQAILPYNPFLIAR